MSTTTNEPEGNPASGTAQGLIDFLTWVIANNYMNSATGSSLRTAVKKVIEAEDDLAVDVRDADIDDILLRFGHRNRGRMKEETVEVYETRFKQALNMYIKWLNKDKDWLPSSSRPRRSGEAKPRTARPAAPAAPASPVTLGDGATPPQPGLITYPFPIRPGVQVRLTLPDNLTRREAERIGAFVKTLAMEDERVFEHSPLAIEGVLMDETE